jgi:hypothetical protein
MSTFYDEVQKIASAIRRVAFGVAAGAAARAGEARLSDPSGFEETADALDVTPAFCYSVATFYDMFHLEPVGTHTIEICTNLPCGLCGAQKVVEAFEQELGIKAGETTEDGTSRSARSSASAAAGTRPSSPSTTATATTSSPRTQRRSSEGSMAEQITTLLGGTEDHDLTKIAEYQAVGGYGKGLERARAMSSTSSSTSSRRRRCAAAAARLPMGRKASLIDRKSAKPKYLVINADESEPGAFKDRQVMATVPHRLIEGCLIAAHAIESKDVFIYIRGEYLTEYEILAAAVEEARKAKLLGGVEITVHRGAGAYICGEETALSSRSRASGGQPRPRPPFRRSPASTWRRRRSTTSARSRPSRSSST